MLCPKCGVGVRFEPSSSGPVYSTKHETHKQYGYDVAHGFCPECNQLIVMLRYGQYFQHNFNDDSTREISPDREEIIYPKPRRGTFVEPEVPERYRSDYLEATAVLAASAKACAAMARRLLQDIIQNHFKITGGSLAAEISAFLQLPGLPTYLIEQVDAIRAIGNFAAHPLKDTNTGQVIDVEPGEAEWLLGTIEALFDFAFVQPKRVDELRKKLNAKLTAAGKPSLK
jgi:hypothetical protein